MLPDTRWVKLSELTDNIREARHRAPRDTEMLPASNFVCEFGECVRPTSPLLGACGKVARLLNFFVVYHSRPTRYPRGSTMDVSYTIRASIPPMLPW